MKISGLVRQAAVAVASSCLICGGAALVQAQTTGHAQPPAARAERSRFVISARAGAVNLVVGEASFQPRGESGTRALTSSVDLEAGDRVLTGGQGAVEILLAPGSYFRVGADSAVEMVDTALDHTRLRVESGSAIAEITAEDKNFSTEILTPRGAISLSKKGLYRINVNARATELLVYKGEARFGAEATKVKKNNILTIGDAGTRIAENKASFDEDNRDGFDAWSRARAESLAAANRRLGSGDVDTALSGYMNSDLYRLSRYPSFGVWVYDSFLGYRTFLPFYSGWGSPYGFGYRSSFGWPSRYYYPGRVIVRRMPVERWPTRGERPVTPVGRMRGGMKNPEGRSHPRPAAPRGARAPVGKMGGGRKPL